MTLALPLSAPTKLLLFLESGLIYLWKKRESLDVKSPDFFQSVRESVSWSVGDFVPSHSAECSPHFFFPILRLSAHICSYKLYSAHSLHLNSARINLISAHWLALLSLPLSDQNRCPLVFSFIAVTFSSLFLLKLETVCLPLMFIYICLPNLSQHFLQGTKEGRKTESRRLKLKKKKRRRKMSPLI